MVEAVKEAPAPEQKPQPKKEITMCEHDDMLSTYCRICDMALCNDCYFDNHAACGRGMTLKQAATLQIDAFKSVLNLTSEEYESCSNMKNTVQQQMGIEEEVIEKVDHQYEQLKKIVDEQRKEAFVTIKNLESIQEYTPPPKDFSQNTLSSLEDYIKEIDSHISKMQKLSEQKNFFQVLKLRGQLEEY